VGRVPSPTGQAAGFERRPVVLTLPRIVGGGIPLCPKRRSHVPHAGWLLFPRIPSRVEVSGLCGMSDALSSPRSRSLRPALATSPPLTRTPLDRQAAGLVLGFPPISMPVRFGRALSPASGPMQHNPRLIRRPGCRSNWTTTCTFGPGRSSSHRHDDWKSNGRVILCRPGRSFLLGGRLREVLLSPGVGAARSN